MKVLITGACGLLGTRLTEVLQQRNREVRCLVMPGQDAAVLKSLGAEIITADMTDPKALGGLGNDVLTVFHISGVNGQSGIKDLFKINTGGTANILRESALAEVNRFIYVSSAEIFESPDKSGEPLKEEDKVKPRKRYGLSIYSAEEMVQDFYSQGLLDTVILRPAMIYGLGKLKDWIGYLYGPDNTRSLTYIDNLIQALILAEDKEAGCGQAYFVADRKPYKIIDIYRAAGKISGVELKQRHISGPAVSFYALLDTVMQNMGFYDPGILRISEANKNKVYSIEKAELELGYNPRIDLEEGMKRWLERGRV